MRTLTQHNERRRHQHGSLRNLLLVAVLVVAVQADRFRHADDIAFHFLQQPALGPAFPDRATPVARVGPEE
jgi:hypothetical protein